MLLNFFELDVSKVNYRLVFLVTEIIANKIQHKIASSTACHLITVTLPFYFKNIFTFRQFGSKIDSYKKRSGGTSDGS